MLLIVFFVLVSSTSALRCDYKGYKDERVRTTDTAEWFNSFVDSWYQTNRNELMMQVQNGINQNINSALPSWIVSLKLLKLGFPENSAPAITRITSEQEVVGCVAEDGTVVHLRRVSFDINLLFHSKKTVAVINVELPLGASGTLGVNNVNLLAEGRVEVLMDTHLGFPGIISTTFSFTEKPRLKFNVEIMNMVGLDTFGLDTWLSNEIENIVFNEMLYPGTFYMDLRGLSSKRPVEGRLISAIHDNFSAAPVAYSVNVTITPINATEDKLFVLYIENVGVKPVKVHKFQKKERNFQHDTFLPSLTNHYVEFTMKEVFSIYPDETIFTKRVDIQIALDQDRMNTSTGFTYSTEEDGSWYFRLDIWAYLLPAVLIEQNRGEVEVYPTFFSEAACNTGCPNKGMLYVHIHKGSNLTVTSGLKDDIDALIKVSINTKQVHEVKASSNTPDPIFNDRFEFVVTPDDLTAQVLKFEVWDYDKFSNNDFIGTSTIHLSHESVYNAELRLDGGQEDGESTGGGTLFVSVVFRPVPFFK